jgi:type I restriction enzyme, S subunit
MVDNPALNEGWKYCPFSSFLTPIDRGFSMVEDEEYRVCGVRWYGNGAFIREIKFGRDIKIKAKNLIQQGDVIYNKLFAWKGSFAIVNGDLDGCCVSDEFPMFQIDETIAVSKYLEYFFQTNRIREQASEVSRGVSAASRFRLHVRDFLRLQIPLPPLDEQRRIVEKIGSIKQRVSEINVLQGTAEQRIREAINSFISSIEGKSEKQPLKIVAPLIRRSVKIDLNKEYLELGIRSFGKGTFHKPAIRGNEMNGKRLFQIEPGDLLFSNVFAWEGAVAVAQPEDTGRYGSHRFISRKPIEGVASADFLYYYFTTPEGIEQLGKASPGSAGRNRTLGLKMLDEIEIPLPSYEKQLWIVSIAKRLEQLGKRQVSINEEIEGLFKSILDRAFKGEL